jgi:predicted dehydrogenase
VVEGFHAPALRRRRDVEIVAACDPEIERARRFAPFATTDPRAAIDRADAVLVATPPSATPALAIQALEAGRDVFCEKPIAESPGEGAKLVEAVRRSGRKLQVGFFLRHLRSVRRLRSWDVGRPLVARLGLFTEAWVSPEHERLLAEVYLRSSGPMVVTGAHIADFLLWMVGSKPVRVSGAAARTRALPAPNHEAGLVTFADGSMGLLEVGWLHPAERRDLPYPVGRSCQYEFFGPGGAIHFDWDTGRLRFVTADRTVEEQYGPEENDFDAQWEAFVTDPAPGVEAGYASLVLTHAIAEAARTGRSIELA